MGKLFLSLAIIISTVLISTSYVNVQEVQKKNVKILYFGATWCPPCKIMKKTFSDKEIKIILDKHKFVMYDYDTDIIIAKKYKVKFLPTLIILKEGKETLRLVGLRTKAQLMEIFKKL